jgi:DNA-binding CsgD family transcriptional regulator
MDPLLELVGQVHGLLDLDEFRPGLLVALRSVLLADWSSLNDIAADPRDSVFWADPPFPEEEVAAFARLAHENPLLRHWQRTQDARAYRFSDVCTPAELHATALYREFYAPIGLEHQIAFMLPHAPDRVLAVALSRKDGDFSDAERNLLDAARPFLIQSYRNAIAHTGLRRALEARGAGRPLLVREPPLARELAARGVTARQAQVLALLATGRSDRAIATELGLSERTVQKHLEACYRALAVHSRGDAVALAWSLAGDGAT